MVLPWTWHSNFDNIWREKIAKRKFGAYCRLPYLNHVAFSLFNKSRKDYIKRMRFKETVLMPSLSHPRLDLLSLPLLFLGPHREWSGAHRWTTSSTEKVVSIKYLLVKENFFCGLGQGTYDLGRLKSPLPPDLFRKLFWIFPVLPSH